MPVAADAGPSADPSLGHLAEAAALWAPAAPVPWTDVVLEATVRRDAIRQDGGRPVVGAGMDTDGARRFQLLVRAADAGTAYMATIDPEAGRATLVLLQAGAEAPLGAGEWPVADRTEETVRLAARGDRLTLEVGGTVVLQARDGTLAHGAVGIGCPARARAQILRFRARDGEGALLAGDGTPWDRPASGERDEDGVLHLAERSRGLLPPQAQWAFLRRGFDLPADQAVRSATVRLAAASAEPARQFVARVRLNGQELGLGPVRAIAQEHRVEVLDAAAAVRPGANALGIIACTSADQRVQLELEVVLSGGAVHRILTDGSWRALAGDAAYPPAGSIGTGYFSAPREHLRASAYPHGFDLPGFDDSAWDAPVLRPSLAPLAVNPARPVRAVTHRPVSSRRLADGTLALDLGGTVVGGLAVEGVPEACDLTLRFGEMLDAAGRVRSRLSTGNHYEDRWELTGRQGPVATWGWRVFRYAEISGLPEGFDPSGIRALGHELPLGELSTYTASDPALQRILDLCTRTMVQNNGNLLVDSWSREREPYEADAYLQARANAALSTDEPFAGYALDYLLRRRTWPTEWPFYLVLLAWHHYLRFGDREALARRRDQLAQLLPLAWIDPATGLVRKRHGSDGSSSRIDHDIVDWPPSERDGYLFGPVNTVVNAVALGAIDAMARIDAALDHPGARRHAETADALRAAIGAHLWDEEQGTYHDGLDAEGAPLPHAGSHAGAFAVAMGAADVERTRRTADFLARRGMRVSVYASPYLLDALILGGRADAAHALLVGTGERSWTAMLEAGAGATMEAWSERLKPNVSCAHPWAASPLFLVAESFLGLTALVPGCSEVALVPQLPAAMGEIHARMMLPPGCLDVLARTDAEGLTQLAVTVPEGMTCRIGEGAGAPVLGPGEHRVSVPGPAR